MNLDILREKLAGFLGQAVSWIVGAFLVTFTAIALLAPQSVGERISEISPIIRILLVVLLVVGSLGFVIQQIRRRFERQETGLLVKTSGTITEVDIASAKERILKVVNDLPGIASTSATVKAIHGRADIDLSVSVSGYDVNVPGKQKEIDRALRQVVNKQLGLRMAGRPRIQIQFGEGGGLPVSSQPEIKKPVAVQPVSEPAEPAERQEKAGLGGLFGGRRKQEEEKPPAMAARPTAVEEKQPDENKDDKGKGLGGLLGGLRLGQKHDEQNIDDDETIVGETPAEEEKPVAESTPSTAIPVSIDTDDTDATSSPADDIDDDDSWAAFAANLKVIDDKSDQDDVESWDDDQDEDKIEDEDDTQKSGGEEPSS
jgi:hypothetical protein